MDFVTSPCGTRFPRTPENVAAFEAANSSNEKREKVKADVEKLKVEDDVEVNEKMAELKLKMKVEADEKMAELKMYQEKLKEMREHVEMMEGLIEDNGCRFERELMAERQLRLELEQRLDDFEKNRGRDSDSLKVRELAVREKEVAMAELKIERAARDDEEESDAYECCLSISDPAGDVMCDVSMLRSLEKGLRNEKNSVTTVASLLDSALERHKVLQNILDGVERYSIRFVMLKFKNKFKSLFKISKSTLSVVSILAMGKINEVKAKAAVKFAGSKFLRTLRKLIPVVVKSGAVPVIDASVKLMTLTELSGIQELVTAELPADIEEHWSAIEEFVAAAVCYVKNTKSKLVVATKNLDEFSGKNINEPDEMIAQFEELFDICTSWLGSAVEIDYKKIQRFLHKCPSMVQAEYAEYISAKYDGEIIDELTLEWTTFETIIRTVWEAAEIKRSVRMGFGMAEDVGSWSKVCGDGRQAAAVDRAVPPAPPAQSARGNTNIEGIVCTNCEKTFMPSMNQKQKFVEQNIPLPAKCPKCLGQVCDRFREDGQCPYGDGCKFLHPAVPEVPEVSVDGQKKHSYSCRFFATGHCMSGDQCRFQHGPPKAVHNISEVDTTVHNMSEVDSGSSFPEDESLAVEVYKGRFDQSGRFGYRAPDTSKYRYV